MRSNLENIKRKQEHLTHSDHTSTQGLRHELGRVEVLLKRVVQVGLTSVLVGSLRYFVEKSRTDSSVQLGHSRIVQRHRFEHLRTLNLDLVVHESFRHRIDRMKNTDFGDTGYRTSHDLGFHTGLLTSERGRCHDILHSEEGTHFLFCICVCEGVELREERRRGTFDSEKERREGSFKICRYVDSFS